jgi:hypothetical protein
MRFRQPLVFVYRERWQPVDKADVLMEDDSFPPPYLPEARAAFITVPKSSLPSAYSAQSAGTWAAGKVNAEISKIIIVTVFYTRCVNS